MLSSLFTVVSSCSGLSGCLGAISVLGFHFFDSISTRPGCSSSTFSQFSSLSFGRSSVLSCLVCFFSFVSIYPSGYQLGTGSKAGRNQTKTCFKTVVSIC
ncbi:hypothetical protein BDV09DRAFT_30542 [Aspergillus tetrazonus]